jgi:hypothetical protein
MIAISLVLYLAPIFSFEGEAINPEEVKLHALLLNTHLEEVANNLELLQQDGWSIASGETSPYHIVLIHPEVRTRTQAFQRLEAAGIDPVTVMILEDS